MLDKVSVVWTIVLEGSFTFSEDGTSKSRPDIVVSSADDCIELQVFDHILIVSLLGFRSHEFAKREAHCGSIERSKRPSRFQNLHCTAGRRRFRLRPSG
jgi:hypothetical protein